MVFKNEAMNPFKITKKKIQKCVAVVISSWSLSFDRRELNVSIDIVYCFHLLKCSSKIISTEIDLQP